jgi:ribosomal-protein-alanine N-acetyltransferase
MPAVTNMDHARSGRMALQPTLNTSRLALRPYLPVDAQRVQQLAGAREVADTTLHVPHPYPDGAAEAWIASHKIAWQAGTGVTYAITDRVSGALYGSVALSITPEHERAELGYWIAVPFWNQGYCTEAARELVAMALGPLHLHRLQARHLQRNPASGRVLQKLGMHLEGVHRESVRKWNRFEDLAMYAILAREWVLMNEQAK